MKYSITVWTAKGNVIMPDVDEDGVRKFIDGISSGKGQFFQQPGAPFPNAYVPFHAIDNVSIVPIENTSKEK